MALAFDATSDTGDAWVEGSSGPSFSHTCTGSDLFLVVGVAIYDASALTVSGITYNGVAMTKATSIAAALEGNNQTTELWYLDGPATGANTVAITFSGNADFCYAAAASYTGKTSTGIDAFNATQNTSASTDSPACNVNVVASDCWLSSFAFSRYGGAPNAGTGTTSRQVSAVGHALGDSNGVVGTGNQTLAWTTGGSVTWPGVVSLSFSEATTAGGGGGFRVMFRGS